MPWRAPRHRRTAELSAYRRAAQGILDGATDRREARAIDSVSAHISGMKRYRLDPKNPRQLTDEEARRLDEAAIDYSDIPPLFDQIDWSQCPDVESVPGRCSGAWVVKDSRVIVESCILDNADAGASPEEIADWFEVPGGVEQVRRILAFAVNAAPLHRNEPWTDEPKPTITPEEMERRRVHVRTAIADSRIEGLPPPTSPELEIFAAYIRGEIEAGDLVTAVRRILAFAKSGPT